MYRLLLAFWVASQSGISSPTMNHPQSSDPSSERGDGEALELSTTPAAEPETRTSNLEARNTDGVTITSDPLPLPTAVVWRLYLSHFLSTWNSRSFEFGSVLFFAHIYPDTLLYLSIYAIFRSVAGILLSTAVGKAIDTKPRLAVVRSSIGRLYVLERLG